MKMWLLAAGTCTVVIYIINRWLLEQKVIIHKTIEAVFAGASIYGGVHLIYCSFVPHELVHIVDAKGGMVALPAGCNIELGEWHSVEMLAGGFALLVVAISLFIEMLAPPRPHSSN